VEESERYSPLVEKKKKPPEVARGYLSREEGVQGSGGGTREGMALVCGSDLETLKVIITKRGIGNGHV